MRRRGSLWHRFNSLPVLFHYSTGRAYTGAAARNDRDVVPYVTSPEFFGCFVAD
ncbi:MAG: hypothetical protein ACOX8W_04300 [bacterium]